MNARPFYHHQSVSFSITVSPVVPPLPEDHDQMESCAFSCFSSSFAPSSDPHFCRLNSVVKARLIGNNRSRMVSFFVFAAKPIRRINVADVHFFAFLFVACLRFFRINLYVVS